MHRAIHLIQAALTVSCLALAACGGNGAATTQSSINSNDSVTSAQKTTGSDSVSPSGTTIPTATQIIDASGNVWTVTGGIVDENGAAAGFSLNVTLLLYYNSTIYQENSSDAWWSWNGTTWVACSDPRAVASSTNGTTLPAKPQIVDANGNVWTLVNNTVYENGVIQGFSDDVTLLLYYNATVYKENVLGNWWSWSGANWVATSDPLPVTTSPSGTTIPTAAQITDSNGNVWALSSNTVYENGAIQGFSNDVMLLLYDNAIIYKENVLGDWWSWNGTMWVQGSGDPRGSGVNAPTISGSPPGTVVAGQPYSFVPTTTNPGAGALVFSIVNMPAWASFSTTTGQLTGTPSNAQAGTYSNIYIVVNDGTASVSLGAFSITVTPTGTASLSWTAPTANTDGTPLTDLAGYTIYYGSSADALTQSIQVADPTATAYVVNTLASGTYYFAVAGYTTTGVQGAVSSQVSKTIP